MKEIIVIIINLQRSYFLKVFLLRALISHLICGNFNFDAELECHDGSHFTGEEKRGTVRLGSLPQATQPVEDRARIGSQTGGPQSHALNEAVSPHDSRRGEEQPHGLAYLVP